ncbi:S9 family peptidase [Caulobacter radicis]|uniref:alpha/beta hydrolase family protein n=1 Tax=Caulobacter radicis TaxID=2172650 RepID=UPI000D5781E4|nr:prolyl oligopeptidase family serine peptidase [Caulobacter radicis]PVM91757.1 S9 family peptidase [Caulobacter radicis]
MRRLAPRLLACALMGAGAAKADPFTVERYLDRQVLGRISIDPSQRWIVAPVTGPYRSAPRWDLEETSLKTISQLRVFDLAGDGPPRIYPSRVGGAEDWGYTPGPYSPSGAKMAVTRARGRTLEVGVLTLATGETVWSGLYPVADQIGRAVQWRSEESLLVIAQDPDAPIMSGIHGWQVEERWIKAWRAANEGRVSVTASGSGRYLASNPTSKATRLVLVDAASGATRVLVEGDFLDLEIAPGGAHAALFANGEPLALDPAAPLSTSTTFRRHRLVIVDLASGESWSSCVDCDVAPYLMGWSPDGRSLLAYARQDGAGWEAARYWRIDPRGRAAAPLDTAGVLSAPGRTAPGVLAPLGDWMGARPLILGRQASAPAQADADWFALDAKGPVNLTGGLPPGPRSLEAVSPKALVVAVGEQLFSIDAAGRSRPLGAGRRARGAGAAWSERLSLNNRPSPEALMIAQVRSGGTAPAVLKAGGLRAVAPPVPSSARLAAASAGGAAVTVARDDHGVDTVALERTGKPRRILATVNPELARVDPAVPRAIAHAGPGGRALKSWLYLPPTLPAGSRAPLIVIPYPSAVYETPPPHHALPTSSADSNAQLLAGHGYAVLVTSLPVDERREPAQGLADDILAIVDAAAAAEPRIDAARLAIWGHSYGGWTALMAATQSPRFKAVIAGAFAADWIGFYSRTSLLSSIAPDAGLVQSVRAGYMEGGQGRMGAAPWVDPQRYLRNSPLMAADRVSAPVMMIMGDLDADPGQIDRMFSALFRQNKDAVSLLYHGEGHGVVGPANIADLYGRVFTFLDEHLGVPPR